LDFQEHVKESKLEDLFLKDQQRVVVSTIHKSKGREFDAVILVLNRTISKDEEMRAIYVALTRAKNHLVINTDQDIFDDIETHGLRKHYDESVYEKPNDLVMQMEHRDINLGGSKYCVHALEKVMTDSELTVDEQIGCDINGKKVLYFSTAMKDKLAKKKALGYLPTHAVVTYKVKWYDKDNDQTYWLVLPKIYFSRMPGQEDNVNDQNGK
jgi:ATP-dependent DNA helicase RecQ